MVSTPLGVRISLANPRHTCAGHRHRSSPHTNRVDSDTLS